MAEGRTAHTGLGGGRLTSGSGRNAVGTAVALSPQSRADALDRMAETELDVLVIGGGGVGAGSALDASPSGLRVGLVDGRDLASGTSSRSSKLLHGGLRYL